MTVHTEFISYSDNGTILEGFAAYPSKEKKPLVILCHAWRGRDDFILEKTKLVAEWGYTGFALDMYGKGLLGQTREQNAALKAPFLNDRSFLLRRLIKAYETASSLPYVDAEQIVVLGFGFGGVCALDFARSGLDIKGAISVYGHFDSAPLPKKAIKAKILILHGYNDPIVPYPELLSFQREMEQLKVDWQSHIYGDTMHAFVTPSANDPNFGTLFNPKSSKRAWKTIHDFLIETFSTHKSPQSQ